MNTVKDHLIEKTKLLKNNFIKLPKLEARLLLSKALQKVAPVAPRRPVASGLFAVRLSRSASVSLRRCVAASLRAPVLLRRCIAASWDRGAPPGGGPAPGGGRARQAGPRTQGSRLGRAPGAPRADAEAAGRKKRYVVAVPEVTLLREMARETVEDIDGLA